MDEAAWVARAQKGDAGAFESLVGLHQDRIYNVLYRLTGNDADASDLTQETFLKAWKALGGFTAEAQFSTWLYQIALNAARSRGRHLAVVRRVTPISKDAPLADGEPMEFADGRATAPEAALERKEDLEHLQRLLGTLEPELREAIVLREIEGHSYEEIAAAQGIPLGTAKTRVHRARMELREKILKFRERPGNARV